MLQKAYFPGHTKCVRQDPRYIREALLSNPLKY